MSAWSTIVRHSLCRPYHPLHSSPKAGVFKRQIFPPSNLLPTPFLFCSHLHQVHQASPPLDDLIVSLSVYNLSPQSFYTSHISLMLIQSQGTSHLVSHHRFCASLLISSLFFPLILHHAAALSKEPGLAKPDHHISLISAQSRALQRFHQLPRQFTLLATHLERRSSLMGSHLDSH